MGIVNTSVNKVNNYYSRQQENWRAKNNIAPLDTSTSTDTNNEQSYTKHELWRQAKGLDNVVNAKDGNTYTFSKQDNWNYARTNGFDVEKEPTERGTLDRVLGVLGYTGVVEGLYNMVDDDEESTFLSGLKEGLNYMNPFTDDVSGRHTFSDVLEARGWEDKPDGKLNVGRGVVGFIGDVLLDPLTYANPFGAAAKLVKGTGKVAAVGKALKTVDNVSDVSKKIKVKSGGVNKLNIANLKTLDLDSAKKIVSNALVDAPEEEITEQATNLMNSFNRKVLKIREGGEDFTIGLNNLPFTNKVKIGDKTLADFKITLAKSDKLRELGDKTIAPYYNSLAKKLRSNRFIKHFNTNARIESAAADNFIKAAEEFYTATLQKGTPKVKADIEDMKVAEFIKEYFDNVTPAEREELLYDIENHVFDDLFARAGIKEGISSDLIASIEKNKVNKKLKVDSNSSPTYTNTFYKSLKKNLDAVAETNDARKALNKFVGKEHLTSLKDAALYAKYTKSLDEAPIIDVLWEHYGSFIQPIIKKNKDVDVNKILTTRWAAESDDVRFNILKNYVERNSKHIISSAPNKYKHNRFKKFQIEHKTLSRPVSPGLSLNLPINKDGKTFNEIYKSLPSVKQGGYSDFKESIGKLNSFFKNGSVEDINNVIKNLPDASLAQKSVLEMTPEEFSKAVDLKHFDFITAGGYNKKFEEAVTPYIFSSSKYSQTAKNISKTFFGDYANSIEDAILSFFNKNLDIFESCNTFDQALLYGSKTNTKTIVTLSDLLYSSGKLDLYLSKISKVCCEKNKCQIAELICKNIKDLPFTPYEFYNENMLALPKKIYNSKNYMARIEQAKSVHSMNKSAVAAIQSDIEKYMNDASFEDIFSEILYKYAENLYKVKKANIAMDEKSLEVASLLKKEFNNSYKKKNEFMNPTSKRVTSKARDGKKFYQDLMSLEKETQGYIDYVTHTDEYINDKEYQIFSKALKPYTRFLGHSNKTSITPDEVEKIIKHARIEDVLKNSDVSKAVEYEVERLSRNTKLLLDYMPLFKGLNKEFLKSEDLFAQKYFSNFNKVLPGFERMLLKKHKFMKRNSVAKLDDIRRLYEDAYGYFADADIDVTDIQSVLENPNVSPYFKELINLVNSGKSLNSASLNVMFDAYWDKNSKIFTSYLKNHFDDNSALYKYFSTNGYTSPSVTNAPAYREDFFNLLNFGDYGKAMDASRDIAYDVFVAKYRELMDFYNARDTFFEYLKDTHKNLLSNAAIIKKGIDKGYIDRFVQEVNYEKAQDDMNGWFSWTADPSSYFSSSTGYLKVGETVPKKVVKAKPINIKATDVIAADLLDAEYNKLVEQSDALIEFLPIMSKNINPNAVKLLRKTAATKALYKDVLSASEYDEIRNLLLKDGQDYYDNIKEFNKYREQIGKGENISLNEAMKFENRLYRSFLKVQNDLSKNVLAFENQEQYDELCKYLSSSYSVTKGAMDNVINAIKHYNAKVATFEKDVELANKIGEERLEAIKLFIDRMKEIGKREVSFGFLTQGQYNNLKGAYVPHMFKNVDNNTMRELLFEDVTGTFNPDITGIQKQFGFHRKESMTIKEYNDMLRKNNVAEEYLFENALHEIYLARALAHNKLILGKETKDFINANFSKQLLKKGTSKREKSYIHKFYKNIRDMLNAKTNVSSDDLLDKINDEISFGLEKYDGAFINQYDLNELYNNSPDLVVSTYEDTYTAIKKFVKNCTVMESIPPDIPAFEKRKIYNSNHELLENNFNKVLDAFFKMGDENFAITFAPNVFYQKLNLQQVNFLSLIDAKVRLAQKSIVERTTNLTRDQQVKLTSDFLNLYDRFLNIWKLLNTVISPGFHIQNAVSNAFQSFLAIGEDAINSKSIKKAYDIFKNPDPKQTIKLGEKTYTYQELNYAAKENGVIDEMFHTFELSRGQEKGLFSGVVPSSLDATDSENFIPYRIGTKIGTAIEGTQRMNLFMSALKQGMNYEEAAEAVNKYLFDYSALTDTEQKVMKRIIPFYTFMRKNIPMELEEMLAQPTTFTGLQKAFTNFEKMGSNEYIGENDRSEWRQEHIQFPFEIDGHTYGIADQLPYNQIERVVTPNKLLGQTTPLIKTPIEATTGKYLYTGMDIESPLDYLKNQTFYTKMGNVADGYEDKTQKDLYIAGQLLGFPIGKIK